jgi:diguanylate cyclase (GGDEF)-like protein
MTENQSVHKITPSDLPAPPETSARIVRACGDPDIGADRLARIVASDPILTAEILRTANSAFFGFKHKVTTAQSAVTVLGNRALRSIALCFAVRDSVQPGSIPGLDIISYWEDALRHAVAARILGTRMRLDAEEAFTVGLLQEFGLLAMFYAQPDEARRWPEIRPMHPEERRKEEFQVFGTTHDQVGKMLAKTWALPEDISAPIEFHHAASLKSCPAEFRKMTLVMTAADWVTAVFTNKDSQRALSGCRALLIKKPFSMPLESIDKMLETIPGKVEEAAETLGLRVEEQPEFDKVLREANRQLADETLSYQELTWALEAALSEKERLAQELRQANLKLEDMAYVDPLTKLANRRRLLEVTMSEVMRHSRSGRPLSMILIDLDHFKKVNDTYGHPFGDSVLESVAKVLADSLRSMDIKARIGGEELCILMPETDEDAGRTGAERVRHAIESMKLEVPTQKVEVTASLGGTTWVGNVTNAESAGKVLKLMMDKADAALYKAKNSGRNQVHWSKMD